MLSVVFLIASLLVSVAVAANDAVDKNDCQPVTWAAGLFSRRDSLEIDALDEVCMKNRCSTRLMSICPSFILPF